MLFERTGSVVTNEDELTMESMDYISEMIMREGLSEEELCEFLESQVDVTSALEDNILLEKTIVKLDKKAKLSKAQKMAVFTIAKEKNDKDFKKLMTTWKMERFLEAKLTKKYGNEAMRRAKKAVAKAGTSKSTMVKKAADNVKKQLNGSKVK